MCSVFHCLDQRLWSPAFELVAELSNSCACVCVCVGGNVQASSPAIKVMIIRESGSNTKAAASAWQAERLSHSCPSYHCCSDICQAESSPAQSLSVWSQVQTAAEETQPSAHHNYFTNQHLWAVCRVMGPRLSTASTAGNWGWHLSIWAWACDSAKFHVRSIIVDANSTNFWCRTTKS